MTDLSVFETVGATGGIALKPQKELFPAPAEAVEFDKIMADTAKNEIKILSEPSTFGTTLAESANKRVSAAENVFFAKIDKLQSSADKDFADVVNLIKSSEGQELAFNDVMRATIKMHNLTYRAHLTAKVAEKSNEALQTLYKQQV